MVKRCKLQPTQHVLKKALGQCCIKRAETASYHFSFTSNTAIRTVRKIIVHSAKRGNCRTLRYNSLLRDVNTNLLQRVYGTTPSLLVGEEITTTLNAHHSARGALTGEVALTTIGRKRAPRHVLAAAVGWHLEALDRLRH